MNFIDSRVDLSKVPAPEYSPVFDIGMCTYSRACMAAGNELGIFDTLSEAAMTSSQIAEKLDLSQGAIDAICLVLASDGLLVKKQQNFSNSEAASAYLCSESPTYGGPVNPIVKDSFDFKKVVSAAKEGWSPISEGNKSFTEMWESGSLSKEAAERFTRMMHSVIIGPAISAARSGAFKDVKHLIDAGGGSGTFCMALKAHQPDTQVTLMDLPQVCDASKTYLDKYGFTGKVKHAPCNFFTDKWPDHGDAYHFGNILHDWPVETGLELLRKTFAALPSGGHVFLHEALLSEDKTSPTTTVIFNLLMYLNHRAQQFTKNEMFGLLLEAGFVEPTIAHNFSHYSVIKARKP